jgi:hypothetical protein
MKKSQLKQIIREEVHNILREKKELSPTNVKTYNANKTSVNKLKSWTYKLKDIDVKFHDMEYYGDEASEFFEFINGKSTRIYYLRINIGGTIVTTPISTHHDKLACKVDPESDYIYFDIKRTNYNQFIGKNADTVLGFIDLLDFLFKNFENEIYKFASSKRNLETLYVIKAGEIAPTTGKTGHGWSIYDFPNGVLGATKYGMMLWDAKGMKVGDKFKLLDDQTHKLISNEVEIVDLIPAKYADFVQYSRKRGADIPVAAYKKQPGKFRFTLYSIK